MNFSTEEIRYLRHYLLTEPDLLLFTKLMFEEVNKRPFKVNWHHKVIADKLDQVYRYQHPTNKIIFTIPPRHGKTEMALIMYTAYGFALNPQSAFMQHSYSDDLVNNNSKMIRKILECDLYRKLFPDVQLTNNAKGYIETSQSGFLYSAPFLGQITGFGCGRLGSGTFAGGMNIDDPMKPKDAMSNVVRDSINWQWDNTLESRVNDPRTPIIVTAQRLHWEDFINYLISKNGLLTDGGLWDLINFPAVIGEGTNKEAALWEERKSLDQLRELRKSSSWTFYTQYQQQPKPVEGLLFYENTTNYFEKVDPEFRLIFIDPADGGDHVCSKVFGFYQGNVFVENIIYSREKSEIAVPRIMKQIREYRPTTVYCEAVIAWDLYRKVIKSKVYEEGLPSEVKTFGAKGVKENRIFGTSSVVQKYFYYLQNELQDKDYHDCMLDKFRYIPLKKDQDDDGLDVDNMAATWFHEKGLIKSIDL